ncbi:MAG TPA: hypothetical protein VFZ64_06145 [Nocardioidaceae bacterium]
MSQQTTSKASTVPRQASRAAQPRETEPTIWAGWIMFGSMMMMLLGSFHMVAGFVALFQEEYFLVGPNGLMINVDYTTWGWTHLIGGAVVIATGVAVLFGQMWARVLGVGIAMLSALVNLAFVAAYPIWSLAMIAFDVVVIWALTVHGGEMKAARERAA